MSQSAPRSSRHPGYSPSPERLTIPSRGYHLVWRSGGLVRSTTLTRTMVGGMLGAVALLGLWALTVTAYVIYHDEFVMAMTQSWQSNERTYEDRIANLSGMLDRVTSKQMVEKETLERRVEMLARRQAMIEARHTLVQQIMDGAGLPRAKTADMPLPLPRPGLGSAREAGDGQGGLDKHSSLTPDSAEKALAGVLDRVEQQMNIAEQGDIAVLARIEGHTAQRSRRIRDLLADVGVDSGRLPRPVRAASAVGGPFVPLGAGGGFDRQLERLQGAVGDLSALERAVSQFPLQRPVAGDLDQTSGFGARVDPFLKTLAFHAGTDFRGATGDPVKATADGKVVTAGWQNGYGNLVEIEHAGGISTRYGHLSQIDVVEGQSVSTGTRVGRIGSTGRSTGPHLHYETRVNGEAVDPLKFLRAGARLGGQ